MTDNDRMLARLQQGPANHLELYQMGLMAHSRAADLRKRGHNIVVQKQRGWDFIRRQETWLYVYRLLDAAPSSELGDAASNSTEPAPPSRVDSGGTRGLDQGDTDQVGAGGVAQLSFLGVTTEVM